MRAPTRLLKINSTAEKQQRTKRTERFPRARRGFSGVQKQINLFALWETSPFSSSAVVFPMLFFRRRLSSRYKVSSYLETHPARQPATSRERPLDSASRESSDHGYPVVDRDATAPPPTPIDAWITVVDSRMTA